VWISHFFLMMMTSVSAQMKQIDRSIDVFFKGGIIVMCEIVFWVYRGM